MIGILAAIVISLGSAFFHLTSARGSQHKLLRALTLRVGLSVSLFVLLYVAWYFGLVQPHGLDG